VATAGRAGDAPYFLSRPAGSGGGEKNRSARYI
jgi:hypothetical protein